VDIPGYGWLPVDPTFGQIGILSNTYVALTYGDDQLSVYDVLLSKNENATLEVEDTVTEISSSARIEEIGIAIGFDDEAYIVDVAISNNRREYLLGNYQFALPDGYGSMERSAILLGPDETIHRYYGLNHSLFSDSNSYSIPVVIMFNDLKAEETFVINGKPASPPACPFPFVLLFLLSLKTFSR
jgi:hypothetical protein